MKYVRIYKNSSDAISKQKHLISVSATSLVHFQSANNIYAHGASGAKKINIEASGGGLTLADVTDLQKKMVEISGTAYPDNVIDWYPATGIITSLTIL